MGFDQLFPFAVLLVACLALSFLFSGMEAGVLALSPLRVRQQMKMGKKGARVLYRFLGNPENFLWTILIGSTLSDFTAIFLLAGGLYLALTSQPFLFLAAFVIAIFLFYTFCDLLPKMLFRTFPNRLCMAMAVPFRFLHVLLAPFVTLVAWLSNGLLLLTGGRVFTGHLFANRSELRLVMQESSLGLTSEERTMINRVLDLQNLTVRSVSTPLSRLTAVTVDTPAREVLDLFRERPFSRIPVWRLSGNEQRIVGVASVDDLLFSETLQPGTPIAEFLRPPLYLEEDLVLDQALTRMQRHRRRLAIVLGRDQKEIGIASLQDILKVIFGEVSL